MTSTRYVKEPPIFGQNCKSFSYWKKVMSNYLKIIELWEIVEKGFTLELDDQMKLTLATNVKIKLNDQAVNAILASVSETIAPIFGEATNAHDMWMALVRKYEGNDMLKKSKEERLQSMLENFRIEEHESIDDMYSRFTLLINEFIDIGDPLPSNKIVTKLIRIMMMRPNWRGYVGALQAVQGAKEQPFSPEEIYAHFKCFEETLRQAEGHNTPNKNMAFAAQNSKPYNSSNSQNPSSSNIYNPSSSQSRPSNEPHFQNFGQDQSKEIPVLAKMLQAMFAFEKRLNTKREEEGKRIVCLNCEKEGHTIHSCYKLFPQMRSQEGNDKQDQKGSFKRDGYKGRKNPKAMQANTWDDDEEEGGESEIGPNDDGSSPFAFMAMVDHEDTDKEKFDFDAIIAANGITDPAIIEYLRKVHMGDKEESEPIKVTNQEEATKEELPKEEASSSNSEDEQEEKQEKASSSNSEDEKIGSKVEASTSPPPKEAKVCLNSNLDKDAPIYVPFCASVSDSDDEYDEIEDVSISTNEKLLKFELARVNKLLNMTNQALLRSEGTNEGLTKKVFELESKVNEFEIKESDFIKQRNDLFKQISNLKIDKQLLDIENRALKSTGVLKSDTRLDLTNLYKGQPPNDKSGLGYKRISPSLQSSNNPKSPIEKGKQTQTKKGKHAKPQIARNAPNHAFRYRFSNGNHVKNKSVPRYYNPTWSNNIYHREPTGWRYEVKSKHVAQNGSQRDEKPRVVFQQTSILNSNKNHTPKIQVQRLTRDYHTRFVKAVSNPPTSALCNYCCRHGHISLECQFRKGSNMNRVAWVPKIMK